jgi:methylated-DNA-protein-cysteine methyltransferase-like protein
MSLSTISRSGKSPAKMTEFTQKVMRLVKRIPRGKVATYGQIARLAGKPHGARGVGWILNSSSETYGLPWQRVLNSRGRISFPKKTKEHQRQKALLTKEGVRLGANGEVDLDRFQWKKEPTKKRSSKRTPSMFS